MSLKSFSSTKDVYVNIDEQYDFWLKRYECICLLSQNTCLLYISLLNIHFLLSIYKVIGPIIVKVTIDRMVLLYLTFKFIPYQNCLEIRYIPNRGLVYLYFEEP